MIKVYVASKLIYAQQFQRYREDWKKQGIDIHSRWLDQVQFEDTASPEDFKIFWLVDEEDVQTSQALILYGKTKDKLRGALIEAGIAIGAGILVIIIGDCPDFGTWQHHPGVVRAGSFEHAKNMILRRFRHAPI